MTAGLSNRMLLNRDVISILSLCLQLVDLKAELYRKQEQFQKEKLAQETGSASTLKAKDKVSGNVSSALDPAGHVTPILDPLLVRCRSQMSGVNRTLESVAEPRRMLRSRPRSRRTWISPGEGGTLWTHRGQAPP